MYPDFLVIGAQKAGTTWLDRNLRTHPQIWLPPEKEIHYFDLPRPLPFAALLFAPKRAARHWAKARLVRDWAKVKAGEQSLGWYLRYYFQPRNNRWYRSLFQPAAGQICGECTPRYAVLPEAGIARIRKLMPDSKIIYLLRDPIDRMWSDVAMFQGRRFGGKGLRHADTDSVETFLSRPENLAHSCYASNLVRWGEFYPVDRLFVGYQEEIREDPEELLQRVYAFLGVSPHLPESLVRARERINSKTYPAPSRDILRSLAANLSAETRSVHGRLASPHTAAWLERNSRLRERSAEAKTP
jgi:hypothetical protein